MNQLFLNLAGYLLLLPGLSLPVGTAHTSSSSESASRFVQCLLAFHATVAAPDREGEESLATGPFVAPAIASRSSLRGVCLISEMPVARTDVSIRIRREQVLEILNPVVRRTRSLLESTFGQFVRIREMAVTSSEKISRYTTLLPVQRPTPTAKISMWIGQVRNAVIEARTAMMRKAEIGRGAEIYWQYYRDCDNWGVVFQRMPERMQTTRMISPPTNGIQAVGVILDSATSLREFLVSSVGWVNTRLGSWADALPQWQKQLISLANRATAVGKFCPGISGTSIWRR